MGCRTANGYDINVDEGINPQTKDGRGNLAPTTIILPTLAMESNCDEEKFIKLLEKKIE
jgi:ribonucleoside-triphosphate reductase